MPHETKVKGSTPAALFYEQFDCTTSYLFGVLSCFLSLNCARIESTAKKINPQETGNDPNFFMSNSGYGILICKEMANLCLDGANFPEAKSFQEFLIQTPLFPCWMFAI